MYKFVEKSFNPVKFFSKLYKKQSTFDPKQSKNIRINGIKNRPNCPSLNWYSKSKYFIILFAVEENSYVFGRPAPNQPLVNQSIIY